MEQPEVKLIVPSKRLVDCEHQNRTLRRQGAKCDDCGQKVYETVLFTAWLTIEEQMELRRRERGIIPV